jgi:hypothetical protein
MERDAAFATDGPQFRNRLNRANFVVGVHDRYQHCVRTQRGAQVFRLHQTVVIDRQEGRFEAKRLQMFDSMQHRVMLNGAGNDVRSPSRLALRQCDATDRKVIALRTAAGKNDLTRRCSQDRSDLITCSSSACSAARPMR